MRRTARRRKAYFRLSRMMRWIWRQRDVRETARGVVEGRRTGYQLGIVVRRKIQEWKEKYG